MAADGKYWCDECNQKCNENRSLINHYRQRKDDEITKLKAELKVATRNFDEHITTWLCSSVKQRRLTKKVAWHSRKG